MATQNTDWKSALKTLESTLDLYLVKKAPAIPTNIKDIIVAITPWFVLIGVVMSIPGILFLLGLGAILSPFGAFNTTAFNGLSYWWGILLWIPVIVLEAMAIPGLLNKTHAGWRLLYYSVLVSAVLHLVNYNIGGLIIGTLLSLYILFQIKSYYR